MIGSKAVHMKSADERDKAPEPDALFIDIGAKDRDDAFTRVALGDRAVFTSQYTAFGDGFLRGRALDDRVGCALLVELIGSELAYDTHFAFTVQEETGTTGRAHRGLSGGCGDRGRRRDDDRLRHPRHPPKRWSAP